MLIAIVDRGTVTKISELLETGFEERHSLDVTFNSSAKVETNIGPIEKARVSGTIKEGRDGDQNRTFDTPDN